MDEEFLKHVKTAFNSNSALLRQTEDKLRQAVAILLGSTTLVNKKAELEKLGFEYDVNWISALSRRVKAEYITFKRSIEPEFDFETDVEEKLDRLQNLMNQQYERLVIALEEDVKGVDILTFDERIEVLTDEEKTRLAELLRQYYTSKISLSDKQYLQSFTSRRSSDNKLEEKLDKYFKMVQKFYELKKQIAGLRRMTSRDREENAKPVNVIPGGSRFTKALKKVENEDDEEEVG